MNTRPASGAPSGSSSITLGVVRALQGHGITVRTADGSPTARLRTRREVVVSVGDSPQTYLVEARSRLSAEVATAIDVPAGRRVLVIAPYVGPTAAEVLRSRGLDHADTVGNAHLAWEGVLVDVQGRRAPSRAPRRRATAARAFTRSGVQILFTLLSRPEAVSLPLRELARVSGVSLGTAQVVVGDLIAAGYLGPGPDGRLLARGGELLGRWAEAYTLTLSDRLHLAAYAVDDRRWWHGALSDLAGAGLQLGGELAASRLDPGREPTTAMLYGEKIPTGLVSRFRLSRDERSGAVLLRRRFWTLPDEASSLVPAVLVYADLVASGDPGQREQADRLRERHSDLVRLDRD